MNYFSRYSSSHLCTYVVAGIIPIATNQRHVQRIRSVTIIVRNQIFGKDYLGADPGLEIQSLRGDYV